MVRDNSVSPPQEESDKVAVDSTPPEFTIDDLLAELRPEDAGDGLTIRELCEQAALPVTQTNMGKVRRKVNDLKALGLWEYVGQKELPTITGALKGRAAFRPVGNEAED